MSINGYVDYRRREFCKEVKCQMQLDLEQQNEGTEEYEKIRNICKNNCCFTTYQFHHWLINHGYLLVKPDN